MKKITFFFALLLFVFQSNAQNLPNNGFETWVNASTPQSWAVNYSGTLGGIVPLTFSFGVRTVDAHTGNYALKVSPAQLAGVSVTMPGFVQLGSVGTFNLDAALLAAISTMDFSNLDPASLASLQALISKGIPMSESPSEVKFWYKFLPDGTDEATVNVITTKWNAALGVSEVVATGSTTITEMSTQYKQMNVMMEKTVASPVCDTIRVIISAGGAQASVATEFFIDDITLKFESWGINTQSTQNLKVYPNPAKQFFVVEVLDNEVNNTLEMFDAFGKLVLAESNINSQTKIETSNLGAGIYFVRLTQGSQVSTSKLVIE
ncbi:MAG: hypothetical protein CVU04_02645 [Bacteroidetes bacterium HGW-Bacteroidetes-20]|nr:MAG: hypothetical protein CVU04_02645 [Bacteroidetes bacterium HGW-Bacteroidetes-20]